LGDVPVIHGVVLLPALQAFLLQDSFLQPLHLNGQVKKKGKKKEKKKKRKRKSVASRPKTRGAAQHHIQATSAPPQSSILALQQSTVPVSVTTSKVLTIAPPAVVGIISPHQRWWASSQRSARRVEIEKCSQTHMSLTCRSWWGPRARNRAPTADFYRKKNDAHHYTKETKAV